MRKTSRPMPKKEPPAPEPRPNAGRYKVTKHGRTAEQPQSQDAPKTSRYVWRPQDVGND